jgi:hypothetical protein
VRSGQAKCCRLGLAAGLLVKHTCFRRFSIGGLDWNSGEQFQIGQFLESETGSKAKSDPYLVIGAWA